MSALKGSNFLRSTLTRQDSIEILVIGDSNMNGPGSTVTDPYLAQHGWVLYRDSSNTLLYPERPERQESNGLQGRHGFLPPMSDKLFELTGLVPVVRPMAVGGAALVESHAAGGTPAHFDVRTPQSLDTSLFGPNSGQSVDRSTIMPLTNELLTYCPALNVTRKILLVGRGTWDKDNTFNNASAKAEYTDALQAAITYLNPDMVFLLPLWAEGIDLTAAQANSAQVDDFRELLEDIAKNNANIHIASDPVFDGSTFGSFQIYSDGSYKSGGEFLSADDKHHTSAFNEALGVTLANDIHRAIVVESLPSSLPSTLMTPTDLGSNNYQFSFNLPSGYAVDDIFNVSMVVEPVDADFDTEFWIGVGTTGTGRVRYGFNSSPGRVSFISDFDSSYQRVGVHRLTSTAFYLEATVDALTLGLPTEAVRLAGNSGNFKLGGLMAVSGSKPLPFVSSESTSSPDNFVNFSDASAGVPTNITQTPGQTILL